LGDVRPLHRDLRRLPAGADPGLARDQLHELLDRQHPGLDERAVRRPRQLHAALAQVGITRPDWLGNPNTTMPSIIALGVWRNIGNS
jgi:hypothetical protein